MTGIDSNDLKPSSTPSKVLSEQGAKGQKEAVELAMGAMVTVNQPGSDGDGIQTRVTGRVMDTDGTRLYRLEHRVEGKSLMLPGDCLEVVSDQASVKDADRVIQATAAQLLQVLGKACPFVGPGLWTVKREEVSPLAWRQLLRLVGEG